MCCWRRLTLVVILLLMPVSASATPITITDATPGPGWSAVTVDPDDGTILGLGTINRPAGTDIEFSQPFTGTFSFDYFETDAFGARWIDINLMTHPFLLDNCVLGPPIACSLVISTSLSLTNAVAVDFSCLPQGCLFAGLSLSNLDIEPIPEPTSGLLLLTGVAWAWRHRMRLRNERYRCPGAS